MEKQDLLAAESPAYFEAGKMAGIMGLKPMIFPWTGERISHYAKCPNWLAL